MTQKIRIGVLFGGRSAEHEVSLVSAGSVMKALDPEKYEIIPIGISPVGEWLAGENALGLLKEHKTGNKVYLPPDPTVRSLVTTDANGLSALGQEKALDVIFPVLHGTFGEDGTLQGLLELANIPYVGAGVLGSSLSMDKITQKLVCEQAGLPIANYVWFRDVDWNHSPSDPTVPELQNHIANLDQESILDRVEQSLGFPVFVKPPNMGSSVGISKAHDRNELKAAINLALNYDVKVVIEKAVLNAREIEVSVLGNEYPKASVCGEIIPSNEFYDYDAKYVDGSSDLLIPAPLSDVLSQSIRDTAIKSVLAVGVDGMARVDFLLQKDTDTFYLNEINTIPGFTQISMYPKLWQATGVEYGELLDTLVQLAIDRHKKRSGLNTAYTPKSEWYK